MKVFRKVITFINNLLFRVKLKFADGYRQAELYKKHYNLDMGDNVRFAGKIVISSEPYLIKIGSNVTLTSHVQFITHDGGVAIFRKTYPDLNVFGKIVIGNNVFIGVNTMILPGVTIGNNVVIGAGSTVTKSIPDDVVAAGIPARVLKSIDEYKQSTLKKSIRVSNTDFMLRKNEILQKMNNMIAK